MSDFKSLNLDKGLIEKLKQNRITEPTQIQQDAIPVLLKRKNLIAKAQTGTGKTLAFLLPTMQNLDLTQKLPQVVIVAPTRELCNQIKTVFDETRPSEEYTCANIVGGHDFDKQANKFSFNAKVIVATPGRLLEHIRDGNINMKYINSFVIDEADQMLEFGFLEDIVLLKQKFPDKIQMSLFSATMPQPIVDLAKKIMTNPTKIDVSYQEQISENIIQDLFYTSENPKLSTLEFIIEEYNPFMGIIFCNSKKSATSLYEKIGNKYDCELLHGEFSQNKREQILNNFRKLKFRFLISTDLSARGFDIDGVTHVINYEIPSFMQYYVHRIGRTGRADKVGNAISLIDEKDVEKIQKIEKRYKIKSTKFYDRNKNERKALQKKLTKLKNN